MMQISDGQQDLLKCRTLIKISTYPKRVDHQLHINETYTTLCTDKKNEYKENYTCFLHYFSIERNKYI